MQAAEKDVMGASQMEKGPWAKDYGKPRSVNTALLTLSPVGPIWDF